MRFDTFDPTGKVSLDHIYTQPDPRVYFSTLRRLEYRIPGLARPYFAGLIQEYRAAHRVRTPRVLDIGCSYGVNAALLACGISMDELYRRYAGDGAAALTRTALLARDRELVRTRGRLRGARFVGLDTSEPALSYALSAGFIDAAVHADLEEREPTGRENERFAATDLIISTGCFGYVSDRTLSRVVAAHGERLPWMAHFVLRMFPFESAVELLAESGYETVRAERVFRQRRFASAEEQSQVLDTLASVGVDPRGKETEGWLYAELFVSRPRDRPAT